MVGIYAVASQCTAYGADMAKSARSAESESEPIEESLRATLGFDLLERLWERSDMSADEAMSLALEAQKVARTEA